MVLSSSFQIEPRSTRMVLMRHPRNGAAMQPLNDQPIVQLQDARGDIVRSEVVTVTAELIGDPPPGTFLIGTATLNTVLGMVRYTNLGLNKPTYGLELKLRFKATVGPEWQRSELRVESEPFKVLQEAKYLRIMTPIQDLHIAGRLIQPTILVNMYDELDAIVVDSNADLFASIPQLQSEVVGLGLQGAYVAPVLRGVATMTNLSITRASPLGTSFTLRFSVPVVGLFTFSHNLTVVPNKYAKLKFNGPLVSERLCRLHMSASLHFARWPYNPNRAISL
jgi:hypothetical protein